MVRNLGFFFNSSDLRESFECRLHPGHWLRGNLAGVPGLPEEKSWFQTRYLNSCVRFSSEFFNLHFLRWPDCPDISWLGKWYRPATGNLFSPRNFSCLDLLKSPAVNRKGRVKVLLFHTGSHQPLVSFLSSFLSYILTRSSDRTPVCLLNLGTSVGSPAFFPWPLKKKVGEGNRNRPFALMQVALSHSASCGPACSTLCSPFRTVHGVCRSRLSPRLCDAGRNRCQRCSRLPGVSL